MDYCEIDGDKFTRPAKYKWIALCTSVPGYTPMQSETKSCQRGSLLWGGEEQVDVCEVGLYCHLLPLRISNARLYFWQKWR